MTNKRITRHKLPICRSTGEPRYRDRHQARHGAEALTTSGGGKITSFLCSSCHGFHLERLPRTLRAVTPPRSPEGAGVGAPRRFILVDIENLVAGHATRAAARALWQSLSRDLCITDQDRVIIGGSRYTASKFVGALGGAYVTWVLGDNAPDAADRALLASVRLHQVVKHYDELVVMSGDHAFADLVRRAGRRGLATHVVATRRPGRNSLSKELAAAAHRTSTVSAPGLAAPASAA